MAWIGIRLLGVFFLVEAGIYAVELFFALYSIFGRETVEWGENVGSKWQQFIIFGGRMWFFLAINLIVGFYCLLKGKALHSLVTRALRDDET